MKATDLTNLLRTVATEMVSHPDDLEIEAVEHPRSITISIRAHAADTPRLIGEGGRNYRAIAALLSCMGLRNGIRVNVPAIREPVRGFPERYQFRPNPQWPKGRIESLIERCAAEIFEHPESVQVLFDDDDETTSSTVQVYVARSESSQLVDLASQSFRVLFDAIGKANGRLIFVDVVPSKEVEPPQPATAAGRFAPEKRQR